VAAIAIRSLLAPIVSAKASDSHTKRLPVEIRMN
jgi:hypothetical protein